MNKHAVLQQMAELVELQEDAIQQHPASTAAVYVKGREAFVEGQRAARDSDWSRSMSLTLDELSLMHRYMLSSSFISAWYHLAGDRTKRDKAAHSCSTLVSSLGPDPDQVMGKHIAYEQLWRRILRAEGIAPRRAGVILLVIVLAVIGIILAIIFST